MVNTKSSIEELDNIIEEVRGGIERLERYRKEKLEEESNKTYRLVNIRREYLKEGDEYYVEDERRWLMVYWAKDGPMGVEKWKAEGDIIRREIRGWV